MNIPTLNDYLKGQRDGRKQNESTGVGQSATLCLMKGWNICICEAAEDEYTQ